MLVSLRGLLVAVAEVVRMTWAMRNFYLMSLTILSACAEASQARAPDASHLADSALADGGGGIAAPNVEGHILADYSQPTWLWDTPLGATAFRARVDEGAWLELDLDTTWLTWPEPLDNGLRRFEVAARDSKGRYGPEGLFETEVARIVRSGDNFWHQERVMTTSPLDHPCAISAHNAYADDLLSAEANLSETLSLLHAAQAAGADLLELDVVYAGSKVLVDHNATGATNRASLADVLADEQLSAGNQILFLEIKETEPTEAFIRQLLDIVATHARPGRHVALRAFHSVRANLDLAREVLDSREYLLLRPHIRLSVLFSRTQASPAEIAGAANAGYDMVEFDYQTPGLMSSVARARALGLGIGIYTIPVQFGEVFVSNARELVDVVTVDASISESRSVISRANPQFFIDISGQLDDTLASIPYLRVGSEPSALLVNSANAPLLRIGTVDTIFSGGHLVFNSAQTRAAPLYDADALDGRGVLVAVSARLASTTLADGATMSLIAKTEEGGWGLELHNPSGTDPTVLRFGVNVAGTYRYASLPASSLSTDKAYFITGAYDGDGGVRMWIDNDDSGVSVTYATGGILNNDSPVVLGADPGDPQRYYFDGEIQMALGQSW